VVRAAAASAIPLISAVGHETDTTLIDYAADRRAPTPTGAAEMAVPVRHELLLRVRELDGRLLAAMQRLIGERRTRLEGLGRGLTDPRRKLEEMTQRLDDWSERLPKALTNLARHRAAELAQIAGRLAPALAMRRTREAARLERDGLRLAQAAERLQAAWPRLLAERSNRLAQSAALLESYSYQQVLSRGFALVRDKGGHPVTAADQARPGDHLTLQFAHDQSVGVTVDGAKPAPAKLKDGRQGSLL
jgi:exodeoxyribonuclease VII large subunit